MYTWKGQQVSDFPEGCDGAAPSPFADLFVVDSRSSRVMPSLPLLENGLVYNHAALFFSPVGPTGSSDVFLRTLSLETTLVENRTSFCKLFVQTDPTKMVVGGTAFFVSPTVLVTARHVCDLGQKYIVLADDAPHIGFFTKPNSPHKLIPVEEIGFDLVDQLRADEGKASHLDVDPIEPHDPEKGQVAQCDFAFLRVKGEFRSNKFLLPNFEFSGQNIAALSYPVSFDQEVVKRKRDIVSGIPSVYNAFGNAFSHRHVAPGKMLKENGRLMAHTASTLKGSSGGAIVDLDTLHFVGIHIEGWEDVNWNLAVCAWHPAFKKAYDQLVLPTLPQEDGANVIV